MSTDLTKMVEKWKESLQEWSQKTEIGDMEERYFLVLILKAMAKQIEINETQLNREEIEGLKDEETAADLTRLRAQNKHLNTRCSDLWDYTKELEAEREKLREACKELIKSIKEDWGISMRYEAIKNAEAALAEPESGEKDDGS